MTMPDTKNGRERKGRNKKNQLQERLYSNEIEAVESDDELPPFEATPETPLLTDDIPDDE